MAWQGELVRPISLIYFRGTRRRSPYALGAQGQALGGSVLPFLAPPSLDSRTLSLVAGVRLKAGDIDKSQLGTGKGAEQIQVSVQEAGAAATVGGKGKPTAE